MEKFCCCSRGCVSNCLKSTMCPRPVCRVLAVPRISGTNINPNKNVILDMHIKFISSCLRRGELQENAVVNQVKLEDIDELDASFNKMIV